MNTIKLNTIGTPKASAGNSGGGGNKSNYKYYDCTNDNQLDIFHQGYLADYVKAFNELTGSFEIAPEAVGNIIAVAFDMSKRMYKNGEWIDAKTFFENYERFDFSAHREITEEDFYHIPEEEIWSINYDQQSRIEAFNKLFNLALKYKTEGLALYPFYKRLT